MFQKFIPKKAGNKLLMFDIVFFIIGLAAGILGRNAGISKEVVMMIAFPGELYMRLLNMVPIILIISAIISGTCFTSYIIMVEWISNRSLFWILNGHENIDPNINFFLQN